MAGRVLSTEDSPGLLVLNSDLREKFFSEITLSPLLIFTPSPSETQTIKPHEKVEGRRQNASNKQRRFRHLQQTEVTFWFLSFETSQKTTNYSG